jgi:2-dehydro-3-deoxygalactonokinase
MTDAALIAVDWGTTRLRAWLLNSGGAALDGLSAESGVQSVAAGGFPAAFRSACGAWLDAHPRLPVLMAGMVGSRNGWLEAPYARAPCDAAALARALCEVDAGGRAIHIVPGVDYRGEDGAYDVMRGEETMAIGAGVTDGLICQPGTHSKWIEMKGGRMERFASFITGELYAAISASFVARLAEAPDAPEMARDGLKAAQLKGGLTRALFQARTRVLVGDMEGAGVRPFISGLLVGAEIAGAFDLFGTARNVHLIAGEPHLTPYRAALAERGCAATVLEPEKAFIAGLHRLAAASGMGG